MPIPDAGPPLSDDEVLAEVHRLGPDARLSTLQRALAARANAAVSVVWSPRLSGCSVCAAPGWCASFRGCGPTTNRRSG